MITLAPTSLTAENMVLAVPGTPAIPVLEMKCVTKTKVMDEDYKTEYILLAQKATEEFNPQLTPQHSLGPNCLLWQTL